MRIALATALVLAATPTLAMELKSTDVTEGQAFAQKFICPKQGGMSISPQLAWSGVPAGTRSIAVTMHDLTANVWHWIAVDFPPTTIGLDQGAGSANGTLSQGATNAANSHGNTAYDGPCPPAGKPHQYQITVYALPDAKTPVTPGEKPADIGAALAKSALDKAELTPIYPPS